MTASPTSKIMRNICLFLLLLYTSTLINPHNADAGRTVRVGVYDTKPLAYSDKDGSAHGFFVDMVNRIAEKEQWSVQYVPGTWQEGLDRLKSDQIDMVLCIAYTEARLKYMDFPKEYLLLDWGLIFKAKGSKITSLLDLEGKSVSALKGDVYLTGFRELVRQFNVNVKIIEVDQYPEVFKAVESGAVAAGVNGNLYGMLNDTGLSLEQTPIIFTPVKLGYAVNKGKNGDLITALDRHIAEMKADKASIYHHELEHLLGKKDSNIPKEAYWVLSCVAAALLLAATFIVLLRRQVKIKTEHLEKEIAERKQAEDDLRIFKESVKNSSDAIGMASPEGKHTYHNEAFNRLFGNFGDNPSDLFVDKDVAREMFTMIKAGRQWAGEVKMYGHDKCVLDIFLRSYANKDVNGNIIGLVGIHTDITDKKRDEEDRLNMEKQLLHTQKLESLGVLAGGIAHDFNNLLMAIIGNADLALMRVNKESPVIDNLHKIEQAAARAADLAKQMLAYSGKGKFVLENIDLNILLEEMLHMLEVSISKKAVLRFNLHQPLPTVEADPTQMRQIIMNLVINASEAIGDKSGVIAITTGCMDCDRNYLKDVWLDENLSGGLYVYLEIADTGCGMDNAVMAKIFDPFFTTKFTGRGLGMAAVLGIVRGHKGAIKVYSEHQKGSSFKILLPASGKPVEIFNSDSNHDNWKGVGKVLLVDDEETVRGIGSEMLHELGFTPITANDGREALDIIISTPDINIVILDLTMPHMDGEQCFKEIRKIKSDVKVIMSSGFNEQEVTQKFVGKGLAGFIQKPYKLSMLKEVIRGIS